MSVIEQPAPALTGRQAWVLVWALAAALVAWLFFAVWPSWLDAILISKKAFINSIFNGVTLAGLYFLVASGFTLVFGLMRNVNLAHGSLYLLGAYLGYEVSQRTGVWFLGVLVGFLALAIVGLLMQIFIFRRLEGDELRQTLVTLGISIVAADLMLAIWTGVTYQIGVPAWLDGAIKLPIITAVRANGTAVMMTYPLYRLIVLGVAIVIGVGLWLMMNRTRIGTMIRAGVDDRAMLSASGVNVHMVFAVVFAIGAGLAGFAGVVGGTALSVAPGEDVRYLLASLVVVIVGGMGSIPGAAIGALLIGLAEQLGLVYMPTYGIVLTFIIMVATLALRPQGIMGRARPAGAAILVLDRPNKALAVPSEFGLWQIVLAVALLLYPLVASEFFLTQIGAYSLIWGLLALSMMLLAGYGGMVSLAQITSAGVAAYTIAIFGTNNIHIYGFGWPWWLLVPIAVLVLAWKSEVLRDSQPPDFACAPLASDGSPAPEKDRYRRSFSLSQTQMTWWFWIVLVSYLYIAWTTEDIFGGLNAQALTLMGIGIGTAIGAAIIDQSKKEKVGPLTDFEAALQKIRDPATPKADIPDLVEKLNAAGKKLKSYGLLPDILSDVSGISLHRFQSVAWTFVLGVAFLINVVTRYQMPVFNGFALTLLGISAGTYLGLKIPETPA